MDASSNLGFVPAKAGALLKNERPQTDLRKSTTCMSAGSARRRQFEFAEAAAAAAPAAPTKHLNGMSRTASFSYGDVPQEKPALGNVTNSAVFEWLADSNTKAAVPAHAASGWEAAAAEQAKFKPVEEVTAESVEMAPGAWKTELAAPVGEKPMYTSSARAMPKSFAGMTPVEAPPSKAEQKDYTKGPKTSRQSLGDQLVESIKSITKTEPATKPKESASPKAKETPTNVAKPAPAKSTSAKSTTAKPAASKPPAPKKPASATTAAPKKSKTVESSKPPPAPKAKAQKSKSPPKPKSGTGFGKKPPTSMSFAELETPMVGAGAAQTPYGSTFEVATYTATSNTQTAMYSSESPEKGVAWDGLGNEESKVGVTRSPLEALFRAAFRMD